MANTETQQLDHIIASRRALLMGGGAAALAAAFLPAKAKAASTVTSYTDLDILNFALNLEYLEANFYYYAAFGVPITTAGNALVAAAGGVNSASGIGVGPGTAQTGATGSITIKANPMVPFTTTQVASYAVETAVEEGKHVNFLRTALGPSAVAQPALDLQNSFVALGNAIGVANFDPFANDAFFLIGAYIFEDVGVTAYHGAAPLISTSSTGKTYLSAAASILAVEAYHAGLIRTTIQQLDPANTLGYIGYTDAISGVRNSASLAAAANMATEPNPDDIGLSSTSAPTLVSLAGAASVPSDTIADTTDAAFKIAFSRTTTQVLNIVTNGGATTVGQKATGGFFPAGLNGTFS